MAHPAGFEPTTPWFVANNRFGNAITGLAHQLLRIDKYSEMVVYLEQNLHLFVEAAALKNDLALEVPEDETEDK